MFPLAFPLMEMGCVARFNLSVVHLAFSSHWIPCLIHGRTVGSSKWNGETAFQTPISKMQCVRDSLNSSFTQGTARLSENISAPFYLCLLKHYWFILCIHARACMSLDMLHAFGCCGSWKSLTHVLELELEKTVSCPVCVLGTRHWSYTRVVGALNHWATFPAHIFFLGGGGRIFRPE